MRSIIKVIKGQKGFTLIEILVVIGIIAILATIVIIAINPAKQFAQARDTQRTSNVNALLNAVGQRIADNKGVFTVVAGCPALTPATVYTIGVGASEAPVAPASVSIDMSCLTPTYIPSGLPFDPNGGVWNSATDYNTNYNVVVDALGRYTISAPNALAETAIPAPIPVISVTR
jgi:prepilin-type N-terminal cleavage/methylation domain-containing protein